MPSPTDSASRLPRPTVGTWHRRSMPISVGLQTTQGRAEIRGLVSPRQARFIFPPCRGDLKAVLLAGSTGTGAADYRGSRQCRPITQPPITNYVERVLRRAAARRKRLNDCGHLFSSLAENGRGCSGRWNPGCRRLPFICDRRRASGH